MRCLAIFVAACTTEPTESMSTASDSFDPMVGFDSDGWIHMYDGTEVRQIVQGERPAFSPDGQHMAFVRGDDASEEIFVSRVDGTSVVQLTDNDVEDTKPSWSPDGTVLVFLRDVDGAREVWTMQPDGSEAEMVTFLGGVADEPDWGPDGILFHDEGVDPWVTYVMASPGSVPEQALPSEMYENDANWGVDGSIVFSGFLDGNTNQEIFWVSGPGEDRVRLTDNPADDDEGSMSPDGSEILFESDRGGVADLWVMDPDGADVSRLLPTPATSERRHPVWRR